MPILKYVQHLNGVPFPTDLLADDLNLRTIRQANQQVQVVLKVGGQLHKGGEYIKYVHYNASRAAIGKYAGQHRAAATARYFIR